MATAPTKLDPLDLYDIRSLLSEEECAVQDTVARFTWLYFGKNYLLGNH